MRIKKIAKERERYVCMELIMRFILYAERLFSCLLIWDIIRIR